jgi:transposase InsO family protein
MEIIRLVEGSALPVKHTLRELDVPRSSFYRWYALYREYGYDGLASQPPQARRFWNKIPDSERQRVVGVALAKPEMTPRELAWHITDSHGAYISESSVYRILRDHDLVASPAYIVLSAGDEFQHKTKRVHELWQTDFTYFKIVGWGWYYLSTVLDDFSRYIIAWLLCSNMAADDVKQTLELAVTRTGLTGVKVRHRPRLLSDNGPCYLAGELKDYLAQQGISHTRGRPYHPMTQGKIERYHRTMKNLINLDNYYLPWQLEHQIGCFVEYYNNHRVHEALDNLTPADVYHGRAGEISAARNLVKEQTMRQRRRLNLGLTAVREPVVRPAELRDAVH